MIGSFFVTSCIDISLNIWSSPHIKAEKISSFLHKIYKLVYIRISEEIDLRPVLKRRIDYVGWSHLHRKRTQKEVDLLFIVFVKLDQDTHFAKNNHSFWKDYFIISVKTILYCQDSDSWLILIRIIFINPKFRYFFQFFPVQCRWRHPIAIKLKLWLNISSNIKQIMGL